MNNIERPQLQALHMPLWCNPIISHRFRLPYVRQNNARQSLRRITAWIFALALSTATQAASLEDTDDFGQLANIMQESGKPLILAFEADYCTYCARLKADHLQPMLNSDTYTERVLIRTLEFDGEHEVKDFKGESLSASAFSNQYNIRITPTLLFLNDKGEEVAERLLGYTTPDFYGAYLDRAIDTAVAKMAE